MSIVKIQKIWGKKQNVIPNPDTERDNPYSYVVHMSKYFLIISEIPILSASYF